MRHIPVDRAICASLTLHCSYLHINAEVQFAYTAVTDGGQLRSPETSTSSSLKRLTESTGAAECQTDTLGDVCSTDAVC